MESVGLVAAAGTGEGAVEAPPAAPAPSLPSFCGADDEEGAAVSLGAGAVDAPGAPAGVEVDAGAAEEPVT